MKTTFFLASALTIFALFIFSCDDGLNDNGEYAESFIDNQADLNGITDDFEELEIDANNKNIRVYLGGTGGNIRNMSNNGSKTPAECIRDNECNTKRNHCKAACRTKCDCEYKSYNNEDDRQSCWDKAKEYQDLCNNNAGGSGVSMLMAR